ncbi:AlpA family phage regulatory protein [Vibrio cholerae]|nr:AlpA family phage regulatory protein [Vibrio cholerae]
MSNKTILIRCGDLTKELGVSKSTIWRWCRTGEMPKPLQLGRIIAWERTVIEQWLESKRTQEVKL